MSKWPIVMVKYTQGILMIQKLCSSFQLIFVIGDKSINSLITTRIMDRYGKESKNLMEKE